MERKDFESEFYLNFELLDVILTNKSALDSASFLGQVKNEEDVLNFLHGYGINIDKPIENAELFGNYQEALQFIRKYFLKTGKKEGLDLKIPNELLGITDISKLFLLSTEGIKDKNKTELSLWAGIVLKVMHTILHVDKDLRSNYFNTIQTQIFDRYYKYIHRDWMNRLCLRTPDKSKLIPIKAFETKSKKSRDSVIIKLLHKKENVAEELFDRVGIRFVTFERVDVLRVLWFLVENFIVIPHNIKPSRSHNSLIELEEFRKSYNKIYKEAIKSNLSQKEITKRFQEIAEKCEPEMKKSPREIANRHSFEGYKAIHFTCRQLIKYTNPFYQQLAKLKKLAKEDEKNPLSKQVLKLDTSSISKNLRFFYPYEVQITDYESHKRNTEGEASHNEYKTAQLKSAMIRLFKPLLKFKGQELS